MALAFAATLLGGCFTPRVSADELPPAPVPAASSSGSDTSESTTTTGGGSGSSGDSTTDRPPPTRVEEGTSVSSPEPVERVRLSVRTSPQGGPFQPRNVGAIWVEDGAGVFVKTLAKWGTLRDRWLGRWREASDENVVDAVTGATLSSHETHDVAWDLTAVDGHALEPGAYVIIVEVTDRSGMGAALELPFITAEGPVSTTPEGTEFFHDVKLTIE